MQTVQYCTTEDGVRIAFRAEGEGPPLIVSHFVYSFSLHHYVPTLDNTLKRLAEGRLLIRYDLRGVGLSQRDVDDLSLAAQIRDIEAVVAALELKQFALLGVSHGGPRAIDYAVRHPEQVTGLILYDTYPRLLDILPPHVLQALAHLSRANWHLACRTFVDMGVRRTDESEGLRWADMLENSTSGEFVARLIEANMDLDVTDLLPSIRCPALVCQSAGEGSVQFGLGQRMAAQIPDARLAPLTMEKDGAFTNTAEVLLAIEQFLPARVPRRPDSDSPPVVRLTARELEILRLIAAGRTSGEISAQLSLSIRTVGRHITNVYNKIGAHGRAEATAYAIRNHILDD